MVVTKDGVQFEHVKCMSFDETVHHFAILQEKIPSQTGGWECNGMYKEKKNSPRKCIPTFFGTREVPSYMMCVR